MFRLVHFCPYLNTHFSRMTTLLNKIRHVKRRRLRSGNTKDFAKQNNKFGEKNL